MFGSGSKKVVYFVRHGESKGNVSPEFQSLDSPLTDKGRGQAQLIAERAANIDFEALIASPLPRAKETAETIAAATGKSVEFSDLFVERVKPTKLGGKSYANPAAIVLWKEYEKSLHTPGIRVQGAENYDDLIARADAALDFLRKRREEKLLVVTHGYLLRTIFARVLLGDTLSGDAFRAFQSRIEHANTGISVLKYDTRWEGRSWFVWVYNDHAHLG